MIKRKLDRNWQATGEISLLGMRRPEFEPVDLPHDAMISAERSPENPSGSGGAYFAGGVVNYRKELHVPEDWRGQSVKLEFEGVYQNAEVSLNGDLLALHPYGYTSFIVDLTPHLKYGETNELRVKANNSAQPNSRWYSGTGIYRHVWLRRGGSPHIPPWGVFVTTPVADAASATVAVETEIENEAEAVLGARLRSTILDADGEPVGQTESALYVSDHDTATVRQKLTVGDARLWSLEDPYLYSLVSEVLVDGEVVDREETAFGIRAIALDAEQGFRLNGQPILLKGGCVHHGNGPLGAASYDRAEERKVKLLKAAGYNAVRCSHNPPAPAFLDACDRLGMLVMDETFDCWRMGKVTNDYHLYFEDWWQRDTASMVRRDRNHPSVIMWSIGNEVGERNGLSDGYTWARRQADFVRSLDDTRPITSAAPGMFEGLNPDELGGQDMFEVLATGDGDPDHDLWGEATEPFFDALDLAGYNYLVARYDADGKKFPQRVIAGTETWPHHAYTGWKATERLPYVIGDFVWTALDYLGEAGIGEVSYDGGMGFTRAYPNLAANCGDLDICGFKRPQSYFRDILWGERRAPYIGVLDPRHYGDEISFNPWGWEPVIDSWSFPGREGQKTKVYVYSADDEIELLVNGVSVGRKPAGAEAENKVLFKVTYEPGTIEAVGYTDGQETGRTALETVGEPAALRLSPDRDEIEAAFGDLAYVAVEVVDADGSRVPYAGDEVALEVTGVGDLIGVGSGDPATEESFVGSTRSAFQGRLMAVVRSDGEAGEIVVKARADGLASAEVTLQAV